MTVANNVRCLCVMLGLRTLCLAVVDIDPKFYAEWNQQYLAASSSIDNRQQLVEQAAERIEKVTYQHLLMTFYLIQGGYAFYLLVPLSVMLCMNFHEILGRVAPLDNKTVN